jgi:hypothetical protein
MGAKLSVPKGEAGCFADEGQLADVYQPVKYPLHTGNMPILSILKSREYGFDLCPPRVRIARRIPRAAYSCQIRELLSCRRKGKVRGSGQP